MASLNDGSFSHGSMAFVKSLTALARGTEALTFNTD